MLLPCTEAVCLCLCVCVCYCVPTSDHCGLASASVCGRVVERHVGHLDSRARLSYELSGPLSKLPPSFSIPLLHTHTHTHHLSILFFIRPSPLPQARGMKRQIMDEFVSNNKFLQVPRLLNQKLFDELCPIKQFHRRRKIGSAAWRERV